MLTSSEPSKIARFTVATPFALLLASLSVKRYAALPRPRTEVAVTPCAWAWEPVTLFRVLAEVPAAELNKSTRFAEVVGSL